MHLPKSVDLQLKIDVSARIQAVAVRASSNTYGAPPKIFSPCGPLHHPRPAPWTVVTPDNTINLSNIPPTNAMLTATQ